MAYPTPRKRQDHKPATPSGAEVHQFPQGTVPASSRIILHNVVIDALVAGARSRDAVGTDRTQCARAARAVARQVVSDSSERWPELFAGDSPAARGAHALVMAAVDMGQISRTAALAEANGEPVPPEAPAAYRSFGARAIDPITLHRMADEMIDMLAVSIEWELEE